MRDGALLGAADADTVGFAALTPALRIPDFNMWSVSQAM